METFKREVSSEPAVKTYLDMVREGLPSIRLRIDKGCVFKYGQDHYICTGSHHFRAKHNDVNDGDQMAMGDLEVGTYRTSDPDYVYAKRIVMYRDEWHFLPSRYSCEVPLDLSTWESAKGCKIVCKNLDYLVRELPLVVAREKFPMYM